MRETQERGGELRDYAKRSAYRSQYRGGGRRSAGHSTKHSTGHRRQVQGQTAARSPPPAAHSPSRKSTPHYTIGYSTPAKEGGRGSLRYCKDEGGVLAQPRWMNGPGEGEAEVGGRRKVYAQGGTGDFITRLWPLGGGLRAWAVAFTEKKWHLAKGEGPRLGGCRGPVEKPDPGLRISVHLVPTLISCLLNPGTKNGLAGPPFPPGWEGGDTLIVPLGVPLEYPAPTEPL